MPVSNRRQQRTPWSARSGRNWLAPLATALTLLVACAPDAIRPEAGYDAFLDRVQKNCQNLRIGGRLIDPPLLNDPYFLDITSRFFNGRVSQPEFVDALSTFYNAQNDAPGIRCLLQQMPAPKAPPPMGAQPVNVE